MIINYMLILVLLMLLAGLGLDAGVLELRQLQMQPAAQAAAVAASLARQRGGSAATISSAGQTAASLNGFQNGINGVTVTIDNPPLAGNYVGNTLSVRATVTQSVQNAFMGMVGNRTSKLTTIYDFPGALLMNLSSSFNRNSIFTDSSTVTNGGLDQNYYALSANALGSVRASHGLGALLSWRGNVFILGAPNGLNGVSNTTVSLTQGKFSQILMLVSTGYGPILNMPMAATYTDNSTTTSYQSFSDWCGGNPSSHLGQEVLVSYSTYRLYYNQGPSYWCTAAIFGYTINLDSSKTVKSISLPSDLNVNVLAMDLVP